MLPFRLLFIKVSDMKSRLKAFVIVCLLILFLKSKLERTLSFGLYQPAVLQKCRALLGGILEEQKYREFECCELSSPMPQITPNLLCHLTFRN